MKASDQKSHGLITAALLAVIVSLVGLAGALKLARAAVDFGPAVGDIVQFDPKARLPVDLHGAVVTARADATPCTLELNAIHRSGGSLVVEQRWLVDGIHHYRVHWAGQRTANGPVDCGSDADLTLDDANLDMLAMAAGGWGIKHTKVAQNEVGGSGLTATR